MRKGMVRLADLPHLSRPIGWFQIGWSHEYPVGEVKPLKYFDIDLVLYRTASGALLLRQAHCPHFGAHLGYGGTVDGECIQCPFHGWKWNAEGRNESIPYSSIVNKSKELEKYHVREVSGLIFMWHHPDGGDPQWEFPEIPEFGDEERFHTPRDGGHHLWEGVGFPPQFVVENNADFAHFRYVHEWSTVPEVELVEAVGERFTARYTGMLDTKKGPSSFRIDSDSYGVGLTIARLTGLRDTVNVTAITPVDATTSDVRMSVSVERLADDGDEVPRVVQGIRKAQLITTLEQDTPIWNNQLYNLMPPYPKEEARDFLKLRRWTEQFYAESTKLEYE